MVKVPAWALCLVSYRVNSGRAEITLAAVTILQGVYLKASAKHISRTDRMFGTGLPVR